jgi:hypothetical protein
MKPIAFSLLIGAAFAIYPGHASLGFQPLFPSARKQANPPVATTGTE